MSRRIGICAIIFLFLSCSRVETYDGPIIDVHMHSFAHDRYGSPPPPNPVTNKVPESRTNRKFIEYTLEEMKRLNIESAVISGPLENVREWHMAEPDKFLGGLYYHPRTPLPDFERVRKEYDNGIIQVFGELGLAYGGLSPNDSLLQPYFEFAESNNIPVGIHIALGESRVSSLC